MTGNGTTISTIEASVLVLIKLRGEPGADADRIEELDHRHVVDVMLAAIAEKLVALIWRQQGHSSMTGGRKCFVAS